MFFQESITNLSVGTYSIIVTDSNVCSASTSEQVIIVNESDGCVVIEMPNVFTPNGDNTNDMGKFKKRHNGMKETREPPP